MASMAVLSILNVSTFGHGDRRIVKRNVYIKCALVLREAAEEQWTPSV
jgi:hypothetical protein